MYEQMLNEQTRLSKLADRISEQLSTLPEGKLICCHNNKGCKFYQKLNNKRVYLSKPKRELTEKLALKRYLSFFLEDIQEEQTAIQFYLRHHNMNLPRASKLLQDVPEYRELLASWFKPVSQELAEWNIAPYEHNPKYPEYLIHKSISGNLVRSKSEALIDTLLYLNKIPYRYECALSLGDVKIYPDFTIRHPKTGQLFYYEHFGQMDDPHYCRKTCSKLQLYISHGIIPSIHLITTFETRSSPLTADAIEKILQAYFLSPGQSIILGLF